MDEKKTETKKIEKEIDPKKVMKYAESAVVSYGNLSPATSYSAGYDLMCQEQFKLKAGEIKMINTGLRVAIPEGCFGMVCSRSGLAAKKNVIVFNAPGIIDADYRGDIKVILANMSKEDHAFTAGDRVAQLVVLPYAELYTQKVETLETTERGEGGFGSTGK